MTQRVVDIAQAVDVDHQHRDLAADLAGPPQSVGDPFERRGAVEQTGGGIVLEQMHQLDRAHVFVGDVAAEDADESAGTRQWIVADEHGARLDERRTARP